MKNLLGSKWRERVLREIELKLGVQLWDEVETQDNEYFQAYIRVILATTHSDGKYGTLNGYLK